MENCRKEEKENGMTRIYSSLRGSLKSSLIIGFRFKISPSNAADLFFEVETREAAARKRNVKNKFDLILLGSDLRFSFSNSVVQHVFVTFCHAFLCLHMS